MDENPYEPPRIPSDKTPTRRDSAVRWFILLVAVTVGCLAGGTLGQSAWRGRPTGELAFEIGVILGGAVSAATVAFALRRRKVT
jgi:hypothetical protein